MNFNFTHSDYESPCINNSSEEYGTDIGEDHALVNWSDENVYAYIGSKEDVLKQAMEEFEEWDEDEDFTPPNTIELLIEFCNNSCLDCDSSYGYALIDVKNEEVLGKPENANICFHDWKEDEEDEEEYLED